MREERGVDRPHLPLGLGAWAGVVDDVVGALGLVGHRHLARDAGAAFAAMLDSEVSGAVNVGTGTATAIADVATRLGHLLGRPELVKLDARAARPGEPQCLVADVGRLRDEVGFVAKIALDEGLRATSASLSSAPADRRNA